MRKLFFVLSWLLATFIATINNTFAAVYTMDPANVTSFGWAAKDVADSLVNTLGQLLPVAVPLLVVGFIIWLILSLIRKRW